MLCEECGRGGYTREQVSIDHERKKFIGPCCFSTIGKVAEAAEPELEYGLELSSRRGIVAFAKFGGFSVEYQKPPEEIQQWLQSPPQL